MRHNVIFIIHIICWNFVFIMIVFTIIVFVLLYSCVCCIFQVMLNKFFYFFQEEASCFYHLFLFCFVTSGSLYMKLKFCNCDLSSCVATLLPDVLLDKSHNIFETKLIILSIITCSVICSGSGILKTSTYFYSSLI